MRELRDKVLMTPEEVLEAAFWGPPLRSLKPDSHKRIALAEAQKLMDELTNPDGTWKVTGAQIVEFRRVLGMEVQA